VVRNLTGSIDAVEHNLPDWMDGDLMLAVGIEVIINKGPANLCRHVGQHLVDLSDMVAPPDAQKFKNRLVMLERHDGLATCNQPVNNNSNGLGAKRLTIVGHDQVHLRVIHGSPLQVRPEKKAAGPHKLGPNPLKQIFIRLLLSGRGFERQLHEPRQRLGNGPLLDDIAIQRVLVPVPVVNDGSDGGANGAVRFRARSADCIGFEVGVVPACMSDVSASAPTNFFSPFFFSKRSRPTGWFAHLACVHQLKRSNWPDRAKLRKEKCGEAATKKC